MATCSVTKKSYIGQVADSHGFKARKAYHIQISKKPEHRAHSLFQRALAKHGEANFHWEILLRCNVEHLDEHEARAIELWNTVCPGGYNIRAGGQGVAGVRSAAYKRKIHPANLPANVQEYYKSGIHVGYQAKYNGKCRLIMSKHLPMEEKKNQCLQWLQDIKEGKEVGTCKTRQPGNEDLPPGIYRYKNRTKLEVNIKGFARRFFQDMEAALTYRQDCLETKSIDSKPRHEVGGSSAAV